MKLDFVANLYWVFIEKYANLLNKLNFILGIWGKLVNLRKFAQKFYKIQQILIIIFSLSLSLSPLSLSTGGFIKIISRNPLRYPLLYHNYFTHPDDVNVMREGVKAAIAISETKALKALGSRFHSKPLPNCKHLPHMTDEYWECVIRQYTMTIVSKSV